MRVDSGNRRAFGLGLGILAAVGTGIVAGNQTVAEMNPFYANLAATSDETYRGAEVVDASFVQPADALPDASDLSYGRGRADDDGYAATDIR
ncbi:MAG: hypothetical protein JF608_04220 [Sphingomonadales bacterium]|nr:hypothetical protein [Sphingomonadales bacterium]